MKICHLQQQGWTWRVIMLSEINQTEKDKYFMIITYMWNLKKYNKLVNTTKKKDSQI